ncbi:glycosyltransferase family 4 protein [Vulcaniibacterium tengchongense]|uniref:Glycosyltransferase involved in cell wall biosynthesis n=1 Tax=Vulcaniibacterium tengchongense TaxID=1273429 RepID=A0A3N4VJQ3_9GAMM|nr:glycosyltransferase family 4 protein [Vulcaniibacterium tengchongense]RPE81655.1 glycosyltransferase involved in cell wall biosynthesis [Vulcaniibacterium tengchongense]
MRFVLFANTDWYLYNFRLSTALRLKAHGVEPVMLSPPGEFGPRFAKHGIRWITLPMDRASLNPLRESWTVRHLARVLREERPDLLHNFTVKCAVYGALAARVARVPAVVNAVTGLGYVFTSDTPKARLLRPVVSALMRCALDGGNSRVILQNGDDAEALAAARLVAPERMRLIRSSGVNTERFHPPPRDDGARRPLRVLLAARLVQEKGVREFAGAAALLRGQGRDVEFLLAGQPDPGNPHTIERAEVEAWQKEGRLRWLGHVDDMPALLHTVDVMALPSYYREGVPKSLIEGAASGLALVTTNLPGCREVVARDGVDGLHVAPRDAASLAAALARLDDDRALLRRLGDAARQRALQHFDERLVIERTLEVYGELLRAPLPAAPAMAATHDPARLA